MEENKDKNYIVKSSVLPEVFIKVMQVKQILSEGTCIKINDAVKTVGISRSTYYKYKDSIFDLYDERKDNIITVMLMLEHVKGTLSRILDLIAKHNANVLTINQNIPQNNMAMVSLSIEVSNLDESIEELFDSIKSQNGVKSLRMVSKF
ncbi:MAG: ACT domain-containing protein [Clostridium sp.]